MTWTIILEDENKEAILTLSDEFSVNSDISNFKLLRYLDAYGDTVFNRLQMDDLLMDLEALERLEDNNLIQDLQALAKHCKREHHTYLVFYGD